MSRRAGATSVGVVKQGDSSNDVCNGGGQCYSLCLPPLILPMNRIHSSRTNPLLIDILYPAQEKQKMLLGSKAGHFSMVRYILPRLSSLPRLNTTDPIELTILSIKSALHLADVITELNGFCGIMSIFSSMRYCLDANHPHDTTHLWRALGFMPFGLFFDFMDGKVARWRKKSSLMGQELDSLADLVYHTPPSIPIPRL